MALAETARLVTELDLKDRLSGGLAKARGELSGLNAATSSAQGRLGRLSGVAAGASGAFGTLKGRVGQLAGGIGLLAGTGGVIGLAAGLSSAVSQAQHFGDAMELVHTQAGASQSEVAALTKSVLALAPAVGTTPEELAAGLFHVESAGLRGAKALELLKIAAQGAKVGNADLESVTNALIASVNSGVKGVSSMSEAMGVLNGVVGSGNMRMQDLADAFSTGILSSAKAFGISIQSVGAALADMTNQGIPAIDAATRLRMTISLLGAPTSKAAKELKLIGISGNQLANDMRGPGGILAAVADLKTHLDKSGLSLTEQAALISRAFGGGRSSSAILTLLGSLEKFKVIQDQVNRSTGAFGQAWEATTRDAGFKFDKFKATVSSTLILIGDELLPSITDALGEIGTWIASHQSDLVSFTRSAIGVAKSAVGTITTVFGAISKGWGMIPKPLRDLLLTGFIANKTVKFLFGFSAVDLVKGLAGLAGGLGKMIFQRGNSPLTPLFVADVTGGGGAGGVLGMGEKVLGGLTVAGFATAVGAGVLASLGLAGGVAVSGNVAQQYQDLNNTLKKVGLTDREMGAAKFAAGGEVFQQAAIKHGFAYSLAEQQAATKKLAELGYKIDQGTDVLKLIKTNTSTAGSGDPASAAHFKGAQAQSVAENAATTLTQTLRNLGFTPNMGPKGRAPLLEQGARTGTDPFGEQALAIFRQAANPKAPAIMGEISRHIAELRDVERYYLNNGNIAAAAHSQQTIASLEKLIGVTSAEDAKARTAINRASAASLAADNRTDGHQAHRAAAIIAATRNAGVTAARAAMGTARATVAGIAPHLRNIAGADYATAAHTARIAAKNFSPSVTVNAYTSVSVSDVVRSLTSAHIATGGPGGPGGFII